MNRRKTILLTIALMLFLTFTGCKKSNDPSKTECKNHYFVDATCTEAKKCPNCNATEGVNSVDIFESLLANSA